MPFRRRIRPIIQTRKHEITWSNLGQDAGTAATTVVLAKGTQAADITDATPTEVQTGANIPWLYLEFHFGADNVAAVNVIHWTIAKEPFGTSLGNPNIYQNITRRFIFRRGMEMLPKDVSTVFKRIIPLKVPRRMQRLGMGDQLVFKYQSSITNTINACGICVYKAQND